MASPFVVNVNQISAHSSVNPHVAPYPLRGIGQANRVKRERAEFTTMKNTTDAELSAAVAAALAEAFAANEKTALDRIARVVHAVWCKVPKKHSATGKRYLIEAANLKVLSPAEIMWFRARERVAQILDLGGVINPLNEVWAPAEAAIQQLLTPSDQGSPATKE